MAWASFTARVTRSGMPVLHSLGEKTPSGTPRSLAQPLERAGPEQAFRGDVSVFDVGVELWLDPCGLGFPHRLCELLLRADDGIERLADLRRFGPAPARPDLPQVAQLFPFLLAEVERGHAGRVLDETNDGEFFALHRLDLLPSLHPLRPVRRVNPLRDDALIVQLAGRFEQRPPVTLMVLAVEDECFQPVL